MSFSDLIKKKPKNDKAVKEPSSKLSDKKSEEHVKVNPLLNLFYRLTGEWPLSGPPELTEQEYKQLFTSAPAFVDYFSIVEYDEKSSSYILDDYQNVAKVFRVNTRYMAARSEAALERFNVAVMQALNSLPTNDESSYVVQVYAEAQEANSIAEDLRSAMEEHGVINDPLSQEVLRVTAEHAELLSHKKGIFPDSRMAGGTQGWRLTEQLVYIVIYIRRSDKFWKKNKRTPVEQIEYDLQPFITAMVSAGISLDSLQPHELINWLAPYFGHKRTSKEEITAAMQTASFDLGQKIFHHQPIYHRSDDDRERGIYKFGDAWLRYLTIGGIESPPRDGVMTIGEQQIEGADAKIDASLFERLPPGSMMSYTIIPQTDFEMKNEVTQILLMSQDAVSREARYATEQAEEVQEEMMRNKHKVFYIQLGVYLRAASLQELLDATENTISIIRGSKCMDIINPRYDLISQDSFIRSLPTVYSFEHDRKAALRARKCYTAHLASLLPFYGNKSGSRHPCYIMYSRTGEPFYSNPFHPNERERVSHEVFFGPSGSGKSATIVYMTLMSMAVNNPRMFIFDYGNSFGLLADYMERYGKKVKRIVFNANSNDVLAPFFETKKALAEAEKAKQISDGTYKVSKEANENGDADDERRSYLQEMEFILRIMITGGNSNVELSLTHISRIQKALVRGLEISVERGEPHARPTHIAEAMREMADDEATREGGIKDIALNLRDMADAIDLWTKGLRGTLFNRTSEGFDPSYDFTVIELGALGKAGSADMLAVAGLATMYTITALAEQQQMSGRSIEVKIDEAHLWSKVPMLMEGLIVAAKVFRKLNTWLNVITQDVSDFQGEAAKILTNAEFWWLMQMSEKEIKQICTILNLDEEMQHLIRFPRKENRRFVEGISINRAYPNALIRYVPPSLMLALGQTDGKEKEARQRIMNEEGISELDAAIKIASQIHEARKSYQNQEM